jgi:hypothetical protein
MEVVGMKLFERNQCDRSATEARQALASRVHSTKQHHNLWPDQL